MIAAAIPVPSALIAPCFPSLHDTRNYGKNQIQTSGQPHSGACFRYFQSMRNGVRWASPEGAIEVMMRHSEIFTIVEPHSPVPCGTSRSLIFMSTQTAGVALLGA